LQGEIQKIIAYEDKNGPIIETQIFDESFSEYSAYVSECGFLNASNNCSVGQSEQCPEYIDFFAPDSPKEECDDIVNPLPTIRKILVPAHKSNAFVLDRAGQSEGKDRNTEQYGFCNHARAYRRQTAGLIERLDALLGTKQQPKSSRRKKALKRKPKSIKPRSKNVVLRLAVETIFRIQCDEQVILIRVEIEHSYIN
jgi:hypothetical protein